MLLTEIRNILDVFKYFDRPDHEIFEDLRSFGLLKSQRCLKSMCRRPMMLIKHSVFKGGFCYKCPKCKSIKSPIAGTFFEKTTLSFENIFCIMFSFICRATPKNTALLNCLALENVIQYYIFFCKVCSWKLHKHMNQFPFGGLNTIVQIQVKWFNEDEYYCHDSKPPRKKWVLGMYDCTLRQCLVIYVQNKTATSVIPVICKYVKPGTEIWTTTTKCFSELGTLGQVSPYLHKAVSHCWCFIDPTSYDYKNNILTYWTRLRKFLFTLDAMHSPHVSLYIDYFTWTLFYGQSFSKTFATFLEHLKEKYPV